MTFPTTAGRRSACHTSTPHPHSIDNESSTNWLVAQSRCAYRTLLLVSCDRRPLPELHRRTVPHSRNHLLVMFPSELEFVCSSVLPCHYEYMRVKVRRLLAIIRFLAWTFSCLIFSCLTTHVMLYILDPDFLVILNRT